jgi:hypothetical protein
MAIISTHHRDTEDIKVAQRKAETAHYYAVAFLIRGEVFRILTFQGSQTESAREKIKAARPVA